MKRIIICADGTWNLRDQVDEDTGKRRPTNVTKVARAVKPCDAGGVPQTVFYHDGVGTRGALDKITGGAFGHGMEENIRNLYRSIVYNFVPGDELFFFGFSRGAFTVRSLAGFMSKVGLIEKDDDFFLPEIYACYENDQGPGTPEWEHAFRKVKGTQACPPIRFIGVWDTVGSLGAPGVIGRMASWFNGNKYAYHEVGLHPMIENAYHALALDERRRPFKPTLWTRPKDWTGTLEQAWFAGVHSNIGGGYTPDGLANEALHWILGKAEALGLELDNRYLDPFLPCFNSKRHNSMSLKYRVFFPYDRPLSAAELIHQSAMDRRAYYDGRTVRPEPWAEKKPYAPKQLEKFIAAAKPKTFAQTMRVRRGEPCPWPPPSTP